MSATILEQLRRHTKTFNTITAGRGDARTSCLVPTAILWLRYLNRVGYCADLDSLSASYRIGDDLMAALEALHRQRCLEGITAYRLAHRGIEAALDSAVLAPPDQDPPVDALLDLPEVGFVANLLRRSSAAQQAPVVSISRKAKNIPLSRSRETGCRKPSIGTRKVA